MPLSSIINKRRFAMTIHLILPIAAILGGLSACGGSQPLPPAANPDLLAALKNRPSLTQFTRALESTGVAVALLSSGSYTIFAPVNEAVSTPLDQATIRHHILTARKTFSDMAGESTSYDTLNNDQIEIDVTDRIAIGTGLMVESDINATNGVIHVIDRVQTPEGAAEPSAPANTTN